MAKSQSQRTKDHLARIRRKAQAYELLVVELKVLPLFLDADNSAIPHILRFVERAEKALSE